MRKSISAAAFSAIASLGCLTMPEPASAVAVFNPANGHYYEYVSVRMTWQAARDAAANASYLGMNGYLATITSAAEQTFIEGLLSSVSLFFTTNIWIGGSDEAVEGEWRWVTGPEAGTMFWLGGRSGSSVGGAYENWQKNATGSRTQPDNHGNEDFVTIEYFRPLPHQPSRTLYGWNDSANFRNPVAYLVEYSPRRVTEPGSLTLFGIGVAALCFSRRRTTG